MSSVVSISQHEEIENLRHRRKKRIPLSFILAGIAILGAVMYLVYANTQASAVYYMTISELRHCTTCTTQLVRVAGYVQEGTIVRDDQHQRISFTVVDNVSDIQTTQTAKILSVSYTGVVPDIFRPGIQVVVEGHYSGQGPFQATTLLAKCPSKFQSATPATK